MTEEDSYFWWSKSDLDELDRYLEANPPCQHMFVDEKGHLHPYHIAEAAGFTGAAINWMFFKSDVLQKYRENKFVDIGYDGDRHTEYIRLLSHNPKLPPESRMNFYSKPFVDIRHTIHTNETLLMVDPEEYYMGIPYSERAGHWDLYRVPTSQVEIPKLNI